MPAWGGCYCDVLVTSLVSDEDMVEDSDTSVLALPLENSKDDDDARDLCDEVDGDHFNCL